MPAHHRKRALGINLALLCLVSLFLVAILGVGVYVGMQAFVQGEISKAAGIAAMAGASSYYSSNAGGRPTPNATTAKNIATSTFNAVVSNSGALKGMGATLTSVTNRDANDSITVKAKGTFATPFLAPVGLEKIEVTGSGTARALKYMAAGSGSAVGPISLMPDGTMSSMQQTLELAFPLIDNPGTDLYIEQAQQSQYAIEACNDQSCYDLVPAAQPTGTGRITNRGTIIGTCTIDLAKVGVRKASKLRFTHGNVYATAYGGGTPTIPTYPTPVAFSAVAIFGYASLCPDETNCPVPAGFAPVE